MLRIVHTADCHLDAPCASLDAGVRARVRAAEREAFARVCTLAIERDAHALVIAGDVFERSDVGPAALHHALAQLARVTEAGIAVDRRERQPRSGSGARAARPGGLHARAHPRAGRRRALGRRRRDARARRRDRPRRRGRGHEPRPAAAAGAERRLDRRAACAGRRRLGARERYAPCSPDDLDRGYAYWALGHVHERQSLRAQPPAWYAGCLSPHDVGEPGAKGALVVEIDAAGRAEVEFVPLAPVRFERLRLETWRPRASPASRARRWPRSRRRSPERRARSSSCALELRGRSPLAAALRDPEERESSAEELALALGALSVELRCEHLRPPLELERHRGQPHLLGAALEIAAAPPPTMRCSTSSLRPCSRATAPAMPPPAAPTSPSCSASSTRRSPRHCSRRRPREDRPHPRRRLRPARRARARGPGRGATSSSSTARTRPASRACARSSPRCSTASRPPRARITPRRRSTATPTASSSWRCRMAVTSASSATCAPVRRLVPGAARRRRSSRTGRSPRSPGSSAAPTWRCTPSTPTSCAASTPPPGARSSSGCSAGHRPRSCGPPRSPPRSSRAAADELWRTTAAASRARRS